MKLGSWRIASPPAATTACEAGITGCEPFRYRLATTATASVCEAPTRKRPGSATTRTSSGSGKCCSSALVSESAMLAKGAWKVVSSSGNPPPTSSSEGLCPASRSTWNACAACTTPSSYASARADAEPTWKDTPPMRRPSREAVAARKGTSSTLAPRGASMLRGGTWHTGASASSCTADARSSSASACASLCTPSRMRRMGEHPGACLASLSSSSASSNVMNDTPLCAAARTELGVLHRLPNSTDESASAPAHSASSSCASVMQPKPAPISRSAVTSMRSGLHDMA
mmetsp:Transcript_4837/g.15647  ORF Transcript_4837/g.15647 Transcript_4837/m.15647 type:complete len:286 (+) Transcript_4837:878-1735(+)